MLFKEDIPAVTPNRLVSLYLMASYLYYHQPECRGIMTDDAYDLVCNRLQAHWDEIEHPHKSLVDFQGLDSTTGFMLPESQYPTIVKNTAWTLSEYPQKFQKR